MPCPRSFLRLISLGLVIYFSAYLAGCDSSEPVVGAVSGSPESNAAPLDIAQALGSDDSLTLTVELSGSQVLPVVTTRDTARADVVFNRSSRRLHAVMQSPLEQSLEVHIHEGGVTEVGAQVANLHAQGSTYTLGDGVILSGRQADLLLAGELYIDAHTTDYPQGLLRAQLTNAAVEVVLYPQLEDIQAKILTPVCSGCHNGTGQTLPGVLNLSNLDRSYESLVGLYSISEPALLRVEPGNPDDSLLVRKLEGTQTVGSRMPFRGSKLNDQLISAIRGWIADGAAR